MEDVKMEIDLDDISDWMNHKWSLYRSQTYRDVKLRFLTSCRGTYRVIYGEYTIYEGSQLTHAIAAWESV